MDWIILGLMLLVLALFLFDPTHSQLLRLYAYQAQLKEEHEKFKKEIAHALKQINDLYVEHGALTLECLRIMEKRIDDLERKGLVRT